MGREIVYCGGCGKILPKSEFNRGRARTVDNCAFCVECRPLETPVTPRRLGKPPLPAAPAPAATEGLAGRRKWALLVGGGGIAALALVVLLLTVTGKKKVAPPEIAAAPAPAPLPRPRPAEERAPKPKDEKPTARAEDEIRAPEVAPAAPSPAPVPADAPVEAPAPAPAAPPNFPPRIALTGPLPGAALALPAQVKIAAEASDLDGKVAKVEFFVESSKVGEATSAPYECTMAFELPGTYVFTAKATDDAGAETLSAPVTVTLFKETRRAPFRGAAAAVPGTIRAEEFDAGGEGLGFHLLDPGAKEGPPRTGGVLLKAGEWLEYTLEVAATGHYSVEVRAASKGGGATFHLEFRKADKTGPLAIPDTGGEQAWKSVTKTGIVLDLGEQVMRLRMDSAVGRFDSLRIVEGPAPVAKKAEPVKIDPKKGARPDPFQLKIDEAIKKGTDYLKNIPNVHPQYKELWLLTLLHAGVPDSDPKVQAQLREALVFREDGYSARTYNISLLAMVLEEMDRATHQKEIAKCAQFLIDNECRNGQWSYGSPTKYGNFVPTTASRSVATPTKSKSSVSVAPGGPRVKPPVRFNIKVKPQRDGGEHGDNSNTQYAALGLRACHEAGIVLPKESIERARKWWIDFQEPEVAKKKRDVASGPPVGTPRGWGYQSDGKLPGAEAYASTGSMTTGAVGAVCIYDHILGLDWRRDPSVLDGVAWIGQHFTVLGNMGKELPPAPHPGWHYYYLYAMERAGILYGTQYFGRNDWYLEGSKYLVGAQQPDGSWAQSGYHGTTKAPVLDTCYAILFLKRGTRPLKDVATEDPSYRK